MFGAQELGQGRTVVADLTGEGRTAESGTVDDFAQALPEDFDDFAPIHIHSTSILKR
jgi:hypothetical protein